MADSTEVVVARLEGEVKLLSQRMMTNFEVTRESRLEVKTILDKHGEILEGLVIISNEWKGVRKTLSVLVRVFMLLVAFAGAIAAYLKLGSRS
jgi:hypothetical protein